MTGPEKKDPTLYTRDMVCDVPMYKFFIHCMPNRNHFSGAKYGLQIIIL